jgi:hypothetical protein
LAGLGTAWRDGEVRPTHHRKARAPHTWRSREDPFEHTWLTIQQWLESEPGITAKKLHERLVAMAPAMYSGAQLRTLQRRVKAWRSKRARELGDADTRRRRNGSWRRYAAPASLEKQPESDNYPRVTSSREATRILILFVARLSSGLSRDNEVEAGR